MMTEMVLVQRAVSKVFGDFVSKVVSDGVDVLKDAIKNADLNRKSYNQNLQTRLYQLMIDTLNRFTHETYSKQDKLYDAAESILKGFISSKDNTDAIKSGLKMLVTGVNDDTCQEFVEILCGEICKDYNSDLYKEIDMLWKRRESEYIHEEFAKIDQNDRDVLGKLNDLKEVLDFIRENMNSQEGYKAAYYEIPVDNRAEEYADKWDKNVFLNDFNKRDKNAGVNIKLKDIYLEEHLPHYVWKADGGPLDDLKDLLKEYIVDNNEKKMLLILGQPGIGKSTLITWVMVNLIKSRDKMLVYQFASDLKDVNWQGKNILSKILKILNLGLEELENKILILDGFDEIHTSSDRERILENLYQNLKETTYLKKFSLIITCRENYVKRLHMIGYDYITLQAWDEEQIKSFCKIYETESECKISETKISNVLENKQIFGIPLILYMILALNVTIEKSSSIVAVYDQIFSLDRGGIYDRCIKKSRYGAEHRISEDIIKQQIHQVSQKIAFWIFENNSEKAFIPQVKYNEICDNVIRDMKEKVEDIQRDVLIGNFFQVKHCEGRDADELSFVHRSIYEYFVTVYFFESIYKLESKEEVAGKLGILLKRKRLSKQILEFIEYKANNIQGYNLFDSIKEIFQIMLKNGMTYYVKERYKNVILLEANIFSNMLDVMRAGRLSLGKVGDIFIVYLRCNRKNRLYLRGMKLDAVNSIMVHVVEVGLSRIDLSGVYLYGADLSGADLCVADLSRANLCGANLMGANLSGAYLSGADLSEAYLKEAYLRITDLRKANLYEAVLSGADLDGADLSGAFLEKAVFDEKQTKLLYEKYDLSKSYVLLSETNKVMNCQEYIYEFSKKID